MDNLQFERLQVRPYHIKKALSDEAKAIWLFNKDITLVL